MKLPQHSLRDFFWLVALVAMGCGWCVDHLKQAAEVERLMRPDIVLWESETVLLDVSLCDWK